MMRNGESTHEEPKTMTQDKVRTPIEGIEFDSKPSTEIRQSLKDIGVAGQNGVVNGLTVSVTVAVLPGPTVLGTSIKPSA